MASAAEERALGLIAKAEKKLNGRECGRVALTPPHAHFPPILLTGEGSTFIDLPTVTSPLRHPERYRTSPAAWEREGQLRECLAGAELQEVQWG